MGSWPAVNRTWLRAVHQQIVSSPTKSTEKGGFREHKAGRDDTHNVGRSEIAGEQKKAGHAGQSWEKERIDVVCDLEKGAACENRGLSPGKIRETEHKMCMGEEALY